MYLTDLQKFCKKEENGRDKSLTIFATSTIVRRLNFICLKLLLLKNELVAKKDTYLLYKKKQV